MRSILIVFFLFVLKAWIYWYTFMPNSTYPDSLHSVSCQKAYYLLIGRKESTYITQSFCSPPIQQAISKESLLEYFPTAACTNYPDFEDRWQPLILNRLIHMKDYALKLQYFGALHFFLNPYTQPSTIYTKLSLKSYFFFTTACSLITSSDCTVVRGKNKTGDISGTPKWCSTNY